jgi:hypothetical protein
MAGLHAVVMGGQISRLPGGADVVVVMMGRHVEAVSRLALRCAVPVLVRAGHRRPMQHERRHRHEHEARNQTTHTEQRSAHTVSPGAGNDRRGQRLQPDIRVDKRPFP